ncbi:hypothetical protein PanWU01x14_087490 [Parasponia andersonii]|uniref:Uncharacterized protein n=1 Tax=Parasponia andersonii TaxID=3476 RepID=A0A2P5D8P1_PARAD|nr:hypothetical protein PanWU01x14_087490 [Parasponia andersonii]
MPTHRYASFMFFSRLQLWRFTYFLPSFLIVSRSFL